jgi:hypothetical protein
MHRCIPVYIIAYNHFLQASELVDEGFMISIDYGADADALVWQLG